MAEPEKISDCASRIQSLFGLQEQCRELAALAARAAGCESACLLFLDSDGKDLTVLSCFPKSRTNPLAGLKLAHQSPVADYLRREKVSVSGEILASFPDLKRAGEGRAWKNNLDKVGLLVPLISRDRLIGILALGHRDSGAYTSDERSLLETVTGEVAVSMEKEYLREQLARRGEELSVINRSSAIMASSLDIQRIFDSFIKELRKIADIDWASINLIAGSDLCLLALSSKIGSAWKAGETMPIHGTGTEWVSGHKKIVVEPDLSLESRFGTAEAHIKQGVRSIAYLPLIAEGRAIGSLIVASSKPNAYDRRKIAVLEEVTAQIIMPIENSQLYAEVVAKVRIDELTGLYNRRAFDEVIANEISRHTRYGGVFSLIYLDLDSFKLVNDRYGHLAGDEALRQIGSVIRGAIRTSDQAFRYGGEEFTVVLPNTPVEAAGKVGERIRKQISSRTIAGVTVVTASIGLASWPTNGTAVNDVIAAADAALYEAKRAGGNQSRYAAAPGLAV